MAITRDHMKILSHKLVKNSILSMIGTLSTGLLGYVFHFVVAKKISIEQYGELQSLLAIFMILSVFSVAVNYIVVQRTAPEASEQAREKTRRTLGEIQRKINLPILLFLSLFLLLSPWLTSLFSLSNGWGIVITILAAMTMMLQTVSKGALTGWERFSAVNGINIGTALFKFTFGWLIASLSPLASSVMWSLFIGGLLGWLVGIYYQHKYFGEKASVEPMISLAEPVHTRHSKVLPILLFSLVLTLLNNMDVLLVKGTTDALTAGHFSSLSLLGKLIFWLNSAIILAILPEIVSQHAHGTGMSKKTLWFAYGSITFVSVGATLFYFLFGSWLMGFMFNPEYVKYASQLWLFGPLAWLYSLMTLEANYAYARNDYRISYILTCTILTLSLSIFLWHGSIAQIIQVLLTNFAMGYFGSVWVNLRHHTKLFKEAILPAQ